MSEILFGQSYYLCFDPKLWAAMQPYPPLGTLYAASYLRQRGYDVAVFDAMLAESEAEWGRALDREQPRFAILYEDNFNYLSKMCLLRMRQAALTMIEMARARGCIVVVSGSDATDHADEYLGHGADFVVMGEGERTLGELMDRLSGRIDVPFQAVCGLAWQDQARQAMDEKSAARMISRPVPSVITTPRRSDIKDLDALPFPAWDLVDVPRYRELWYRRHGYYSMNMVTTRGCPYHCNWCAKPIWGQRYNARSPENVVAELKWLKETYQPGHIWFVDDIMGLKPGWLGRFAELVEAQDALVPFKCLSRADLLLREGEIDFLKRAGCQIVWVGAESGSQKILDAMEKGIRIEQIYEVTRRLHAAGLQVGFFLQFGYPGETRADIEKTLQMVRDCRPDDIGMSVSYPLPGTTFYERVKDQLPDRRNWHDSDDLAMLYQGPYATAFYRQLHTVLHKGFRARKAWDSLRQVIRRPISLRRRHVRQATSLVYHLATLALERAQLERLARKPHQGLGPLPQGLTPQEAAQPSSQIE
jgi:anaerobic magnesium-protoporphyrin IX monomethyl ester cyclase